MPVDLSKIPEDDNGLYYKDEPLYPHTIHQRLIVIYSPKYARYQKAIRDAQVERAEKMLNSGKVKKERRNPNDPARFIRKTVVTEEGEAAKIHHYLDTDKVEQEALYPRSTSLDRLGFCRCHFAAENGGYNPSPA